jgi:hypothetical protein
MNNAAARERIIELLSSGRHCLALGRKLKVYG